MSANKRNLLYVVVAKDGDLSCMVVEGSVRGRFWSRFDLTGVRDGALMAELIPEDRQVLMQLFMVQSLNGTRAKLAGANGFQLLQRLIKTRRCHWGKANGPQLKWVDKTREGALGWRLEGSFSPRIEADGESVVALPLTPGVRVRPDIGEMGELNLTVRAEAVRAWLGCGDMDEDEVANFCREMVRQFPDIDFPSPLGQAEVLTDLAPSPRLVLNVAPPPPSGAAGLPDGDLVAQVDFVYGPATFSSDMPAERITVVAEGKLRRVSRDRIVERDRLGRLRELGFLPVSELESGFYWVMPRNGFVFAPSLLGLAEEEISGSDQFTAAGAALRAEGWEVLFGKRALCDAPAESDWYSRIRPKNGREDWFEIESGVRVGRRKLNLLPILHQLLVRYRGSSPEQIRDNLTRGPVLATLNDKSAVALPGGRLWAIVEQLFELYDQEPLTKQGRLRIDTWRAAELAELPGVAPEEWNGIPRVRQLVETLRAGVELVPAAPPDGLAGELRTYQQLGLAWLEFLRVHGMHGILADDMGLGKTVQTLAHLLAEKRAGRLSSAALIVAPTSLMSNWLDEATRFAPELRCVVYHGAERRAKLAAAPDVDLIFTTYALLRIDVEQFRERELSMLILDEAQAIKNAKSQAGKIARELRATRRLCLTGTPMENHLGELWSLFDFLMPGFLGDQKTFNRRFRDPIEKLGLTDRQSWLTRRVAPFLLRRKKDEVAAELPPKTEIVHTMELSEKQRDLYETVRAAMDLRVQAEIGDKGLARSHIVILDALLKLRQICCDPRLIRSEGEGLEPQDSAKLTALMDLLPEMIEEGRSVLLFSQFTSMLELIEGELKKEKLPFVKLTGSTRDRATPIEKFQSGEVKLFLISLKAGGTGLNLTAADTVIHYDPWWNPAVERQATDRAHRIGQDKPVFVYKLLTESTVEQKIQALQQRKAELAEGILSGSLKDKLAFTEEDLKELFGSG